MKTVTDFDEAIKYVHRLGFTPQGNIQHQQASLCHLVTALEQVAGGYPYKVVFHRHVSHAGVSFLWLGEFVIYGKRGKIQVKAKNV
jgi:hypothetical protein